MGGRGAFTELDIDTIVDRVLQRLGGGDLSLRPSVSAAPTSSSGIYSTVDGAVQGAQKAFLEFREVSLEKRNQIVEAARRAAVDAAPSLSEDAVAETGMGRVEDKIRKNILVATRTPGTEILVPDAVTGDHGLTLTDHAPFGVIGSIVPSTNPTETVINNGIGMIAAGNTVVFNAHPGAKRSTNRCVALLN